MKNDLDRVTVVTSIPIPRFHDVKQVPLQFSNCTADLKRHGAREKGHPQRYAHEWCTKVMPFIQLMKAQDKDLVGSLWTLLVDDLYAALPELKPSDKFSKAKRSTKKTHRSKQKKMAKVTEKVRRGLGAVILSAIPGLITLAVESLNSWIKAKQNNRIDNAVTIM